ncbi:MAG: hypothetical protein PHV74_04750, partial [Dehalococcoidia bacterium]|nr:hypothetical protein [Dehalococcoidia bacterium]
HILHHIDAASFPHGQARGTLPFGLLDSENAGTLFNLRFNWFGVKGLIIGVSTGSTNLAER